MISSDVQIMRSVHLSITFKSVGNLDGQDTTAVVVVVVFSQFISTVAY